MEFFKELKTDSGMLRGIIHPSRKTKCKGIVVIIHGYFSSTKLGPARLYVQIARLFAKYGYEVWRFDCYGVGDSDGNFNESSPESRIRDFKEIVKKAKINNGNIILLGHSLGTNMAIRLSKQIDINVLMLLSPSIGQMDWIENLFEAKQLEELKETGKTIRKALEIKNSFIKFLEDDKVCEICKGFIGKVFVFYGLEDEFYSLEKINKINDSFYQSTLVKIKGGDHNFINNESRNLLLNEINNVCQQRI